MIVWKSIRDIQRGKSGLRLVRPKGIRDRDGVMCVGKDKILERWREHFESVLNTVSTFNDAVIGNQMQFPVREHMCESPTEEEIIEAMNHLKRNKAGGSNGILPEMVKACGANILEYIQDLFDTVWHEGVPQE